MPDSKTDEFAPPPEFPRWVHSHEGKAPNRHALRALATQARLHVKHEKRRIQARVDRAVAKFVPTVKTEG